MEEKENLEYSASVTTPFAQSTALLKDVTQIMKKDANISVEKFIEKYVETYKPEPEDDRESALVTSVRKELDRVKEDPDDLFLGVRAYELTNQQTRGAYKTFPNSCWPNKEFLDITTSIKQYFEETTFQEKRYLEINLEVSAEQKDGAYIKLDMMRIK